MKMPQGRAATHHRESRFDKTPERTAEEKFFFFFFASSSALSESLPALVLNASSETLFPHFVFVYQHGKDLDPVFQVTLGLIQFLLQ